MCSNKSFVFMFQLSTAHPLRYQARRIRLKEILNFLFYKNTCLYVGVSY